ncbi:MAG TPA: hypothetical protein VK874_02615 [Gaiellaceae bacterium]|nr:hypothetical protein [Gaiellaceae bacterium]
MVRALIVAATAVALLVALPATALADPSTNVLPVQLTCGGETFDVVVPASGRGAPGLYVGSTSVAVLKGVEGQFLVAGFSPDELTACTATFPDGSSFVALVLITPRR